MRNRTVSGYIACDTEDGTHRLQEKEQQIKEALTAGTKAAGSELKAGSIGILYSRESGMEDFAVEEQAEGNRVGTADLYRLAKAFITSVAA